MADILVSVAGAAVAAALAQLRLTPIKFIFHHPDLESLRIALNRMEASLRDTEGVEGLNEVNKNRVVDIRNLAYEIEDAVDEFLLDVPQNLHQHSLTKFLYHVAHLRGSLGARRHLSLAINKLDARVKQMRKLDTFLSRPRDVNPPGLGAAGPSSPVDYLGLREDELVGIDTRTSKLAGAIMEGGSDLAVVSVVGPHGSGKTTVLKQVFKRLKGKFKRCVWIDVQSSSNPQAVLERVVAAVGRSRWRPLPQQMSDEKRLVYRLKKKKYALFIDGILRKADCSYLMSLLPDDRIGSRVIVSDNEQDASSYCTRLKSNVYKVECLTWEESWSLLCKIVFPRGECPENLLDWTEMLLKRCEGLPAAVVAMGRLLSTKHQSPEEFKKIHDSLGRELLGNAELSFVERSWLQSYNNLPHNKRCCFLYFSNFPEDYSVTRGRLIRLWIAENFVKEESGTSLEEEAGEYLDELIQKGLVVVSRRDFKGNVRSCRVQNLVLQFILSKSEEVQFCSVLPRSNTASGDKIRRLALHGVGTGTFRKDMNLSCVRSLMIFTSDKLPSKLLDNFSHLKVLDFEDAKLQDFPEEIAKLKLLKHLSLRNTDVKEIPKSIENLQSLVTLDLRQTLITNMPKEICKLQQLVYLLINHKNSTMEGVEVVPGITQLVSLRKMSLVKAHRKNCNRFAEELKSMTELRKLGISGWKREDGKALYQSLVGMTNLNSLQVISATQQEPLDLDSIGAEMPCPIRSLHLAGAGLPCWVSSLHSLAKLRLQWSQLQISQVEALGGLPCLVELKLARDAYAKADLVVKAGWFGNLKMLQLEGLSLLERVEVKPGAMPQLTRLVIRSCPSLAGPPKGVDNLKDLEDLDMSDI